MALNQPRNRWWRFAPRSKPVGIIAVLVWLLVLASSIWALVAHVYSGTFGNTLEAVVAFLAALNVIRSLTGLAALRER
jgi:hypothetical protein